MTQVVSLSHSNSALQELLFELRHHEIQQDAYRFRKNVELAAVYVAYELSKHLPYRQVSVITPVEQTTANRIDAPLVIAGVLRAAMPMVQGFQEVYRNAEFAFVGASRLADAQGIKAEAEYLATPNLKGKQLIIVDPMLATGNSLVAAYDTLIQQVKPSGCIVAALFAAPEGIQQLTNKIAPDLIISATIDKGLNQQSYIVPGIGDAGDLAFGKKV